MQSRRRVVVLVLLALLLECLFILLHRYHPFDEHIPETVAVCLGAGVVYLIAAYGVLQVKASGRGALWIILLGAFAFRATLVSLPPTLSDDLHRYVWEGEIQVHGLNPYLAVPADPALLTLRTPEFDRLPGREVSTAYGPTTQLLFLATAVLDGWVGFKLASLAFDLGTLFLLLGMLRARGQPAARVLLYAWCPLVVLEFAGSGHNDSLTIFLLVLANSLILVRRRALSMLALAASVLTKWFTGLLAPLFFLRAGWRSLPLFAAATVAILWPYRGAGSNLWAGAMAYGEKWRNNESLHGWLMGISGQEAVATGMAAGILAGLALYLAWRRSDPLRASYLLVATVLLVAPSVFPWYVTWLVPFLCFFPNPAFLLFTSTVLLSYHVVSGYRALGTWEYEPWLTWLEYLPVYALLVWNWLSGGGGRGRAVVSTGRPPDRTPE